APIEMEQNLGVRAGSEHGAVPLQLRAQFAKIVDLAVEDDVSRNSLRGHGLVSRWTEIDDREPPMTETHVVTRSFPGPPVVRTALRERLEKAFDRRIQPCAHPACDATHETQCNVSTDRYEASSPVISLG